MRARRGYTARGDERSAARDIARQIAQPDAAFVLAFASCHYDPHAIARELQRALDPVPVYGCTSIAEIGPFGFATRRCVAVSVASRRLRVGVGCASGISAAALRAGHRAICRAAQDLGRQPDELTPSRHVVLCLVDWRCKSEELFAAGAGATVPWLTLVGGSASDDADLAPPGEGGHAARILYRGEAITDAALILLIESDGPMVPIVSEHMIPGEGRVVVTGADPAERLVTGLDGKPAVARYREITGLGDQLDNELAGKHPFGYFVGGRAYVRSVMGIEGDCLRFACGVDRGTVLVPMRPGDILTATDRALADAADRLGAPMELLIAFNCYGRYLECMRDGTLDALGAILARYPVVGFNTFGEQVNTLHVNHTLTGIAFGRSDG